LIVASLARNGGAGIVHAIDPADCPSAVRPKSSPTLFAKNIPAIVKITAGSSLFTQWCAWNFARTSIGMKVSDATSGLFPPGDFLIAERLAWLGIGQL